MLIAIGSVKGAPGVTTAAVALAARWPEPGQVVVVECDPSGGSLATRFGLASTPGLVSLAAAARRDTDAGLLWSHVQPLPGGLPVIAAPAGADYMRAALHTLLNHHQPVSVLRRAASTPGTVVVADCGRLDSTSPALSIAREADRLLLLVRPRADELTALAAGLSMVDLWSMRPDLVLVGPGYPPRDVAHELGTPVLADMPWDSKGARVLCGHSGRRRGPARSALGAAAHRLALRLVTPPLDATGSAVLRPVRERPGEHHVTGSTATWHTPRHPSASPVDASPTHNGTAQEGRT